MSSEFKKYEESKNAGATAEELWRAAEKDGLGQVARIRMIRTLFGLSVVEAKEVAAGAHGKPLAEKQGELLDSLKDALRDDDEG